jgi:hypothetical protein
VPTPEAIISPRTQQGVWECDDSGNTRQDGGLLLKANAAPVPTTAGHIQVVSTDGRTLQTRAPDGTSAVLSLGVGEIAPANQGLTAWSYDPVIGVNSSTIANGILYLSAMYPQQSATITKIYAQVVTAAITPTAGQSFVGLYSSAGTLLTSAGIDTPIASAGLMTVTVPAAAVAAGQMYWAAVLGNAATAALLARGNSLNGADTTVNANLSAATYRFAQNGSARTTIPASITPSSNIVNSFAGPWMAIG